MAAKKEGNPASLRSAAPSKGRGSCGHSLLPMEGGAPKGRIGQERYERERGRSSQVHRLREYPSAAGAVTPRIVISSESEKSFSFAVKQKMWG